MEEDFASFWDHLQDLRHSLLKVLLIISLASLLCFFYYEPLISFLQTPLNGEKETLVEEHLEQIRLTNQATVPKVVSIPESFLILSSIRAEQTSSGTFQLQPHGTLVYAKPASKLVILTPFEGMTTALKVSLWVGVAASSPFWLFVILQFIFPALKRREKQLLFPFFAASAGFIVLGLFFAFYVTIPIANRYLLDFNQAIGTNLWSLSDYLDYTLFLLLANGMAFELTVVGLFAVQLGLISTEWLISKRRASIVAAFILSALLTPPDILTQFLLAIPLIALYEALILYSYLPNRVKATEPSLYGK